MALQAPRARRRTPSFPIPCRCARSSPCRVCSHARRRSRRRSSRILVPNQPPTIPHRSSPLTPPPTSIAIGACTRVDASPAAIWTCLIDIACWPQWHDRISASNLLGPAQPGSALCWREHETLSVARLTCVEPGRRLEWDLLQGPWPGQHRWRIEESAGGALVCHARSLAVVGTDQDVAKLRERLLVAVNDWNGRLRARFARS
ncbi:SRPBCC family protein [Lysobacter sp. Root559]|uniref:SRPBCC family protein n=1 Tax=Lysobacter sp. Root559 TaxID=1736559 RepID=UPI0009EC79B5|nr:SRPBCC family protein [Lysobacter sp. Root559]